MWWYKSLTQLIPAFRCWKDDDPDRISVSIIWSFFILDDLLCILRRSAILLDCSKNGPNSCFSSLLFRRIGYRHHFEELHSKKPHGYKHRLHSAMQGQSFSDPYPCFAPLSHKQHNGLLTYHRNAPQLRQGDRNTSQSYHSCQTKGMYKYVIDQHNLFIC